MWASIFSSINRDNSWVPFHSEDVWSQQLAETQRAATSSYLCSLLTAEAATSVGNPQRKGLLRATSWLNTAMKGHMPVCIHPSSL